MTTLYRLKAQAKDIGSELFLKLRNTDSQRHHETLAATRIQSWYRGHRVRQQIRHLNQYACTIQRTYRAHVGRSVYRIKLLMHLEMARQRFYDYCATVIQRHWRGYYTRTFIFNFYARKAYLEALQKNNAITRFHLEDIRVKEEARKMQEQEEKARAKKELENRRNHHLISTFSIPSVYNSPYQGGTLAHRELELRQAQPLTSQERGALNERNWKKGVESGVVNLYDTNPIMPEQSRPLPPLRTVKPQGPFKDPLSVRSQRYKPLYPSLRVATSYHSLEEAREKVVAKERTDRIQDQKFLPFSKIKDIYQPQIHTESSYIRPAYGTKHFRDEDTRKRISKDPFKTLVPPIPVFEQVGKTY